MKERVQTKKFPESGKAPYENRRLERHMERNILENERDSWWAVSQIAKGRTYQEVADELNAMNGTHLNKSTVWRDVERVLVEWKRQNMDNVEAYIAKELARIDEIERQVREDYEKSRTLRPNEYAALLKMGLTIEEIDDMYKDMGRELPGDPRFLDTMLRLQHQRMDLLGIGKGNDVPQTQIVQYNFGDMKMDELMKIADGMQDDKFREIDEQ